MFDAGLMHAGRVEAVGREMNGLQQKLAGVRGAGNAAGALLTWGAMILILILGVELVSSDEISGVYLALLPLVAFSSFEAVQQMSRAVQHLDASIEAGQRVFELVDAPAEVAEPEVSAGLPDGHAIEFRDVSFRYSSESAWVLDRLNFEVQSGEKVALREDDDRQLTAPILGVRAGDHLSWWPGTA